LAIAGRTRQHPACLL